MESLTKFNRKAVDIKTSLLLRRTFFHAINLRKNYILSLFILRRDEESIDAGRNIIFIKLYLLIQFI